MRPLRSFHHFCFFPVHPRAAGLTFIELMLALAATALIGTAVASMLVATSYSTTTHKDLLSIMVKEKTTAARLDTVIRSSKMVLESGYNSIADADYFVLWTADTRENSKPNLSELRLIEYSRTNDQLKYYAISFPSSMSDTAKQAADTEYELADDFWTELQTAIAGSYFPGVTWANSMTTATFTLDQVSAQSARLVSYQLTFTGSDMTDTVIGTASLRNE